MATARPQSLCNPDDRAWLLCGPKQHLVIHLSGIVQGVGFRPFVYRLAHELQVAGTVRNHSGGVEVHAEGDSHVLREFTARLRTEAPVAALVSEIRTESLPVAGFSDFTIVQSEARAGQFTQIPFDLALCADCRRELLDPRDRRFRYPFINCTNCGPRFTIIRRLPYDRPDTTMTDFAMCAECAAEYGDPRNRRYHAQPVACPVCGPQLKFLSRAARTWQPGRSGDEALREAVAVLREGRIVLIQGIGGFHLACDARNSAAVARLRERKQREEKPFAVMFRSIKDVAAECELNAAERTSLLSPGAPIVLVRGRATGRLCAEVAPRNPAIGALLPYSPLHVLLLEDFAGPVVMTSANRHDEPVLYDVSRALAEMGETVDAALIHDRPIHIFADDSIVRVMYGAPRVLRRARGYVPHPVKVAPPFRRPVLAFGADLKNTFCLGLEDAAMLSQHLGDLESTAALAAQQASLRHFLNLFGDHVRVAACDLHPDYASTALAAEWSARQGVPLIRVQHHHAHLAACMAEHGQRGPAVGLCLDGTGYGADGSLWGGEVLVGDLHSFRRVAHLRSAPMPGGQRAAREPWRMAVAWLFDALGEALWSLDVPLIESVRRQLTETDRHLLTNRHLMEEVYPRTSGAGRLFDAIAALTCFGTRSQFEGQAAMELEHCAGKMSVGPYAFDVVNNTVFDPRPMFLQIIEDLQRGTDLKIISARAHETIARVFSELAITAARSANLGSVCLSGGCFQNERLLVRSSELLSRGGLEVLTHRTVPANDGGISLGQACIANAIAEP